jgi:Tfp pilus assembly protein PilF
MSDPKNGLVYLARAGLYCRRGDYDRARADARRAEELGTSVPKTLHTELHQACPESNH